MRTSIRLLTVVLVVAIANAARAQVVARVKAPAKSIPVSTTTHRGAYLVGSDDCNSAHTNAGTGDVAGVPYTTGTTGSTGQDERACLFFGTDDVANDVWFDWTADTHGAATLDLCGNTTDTKLVVWPSATNCPADGTSLACNDDACGLQSAVTWPCTPGTTYTIQLGTFPGAAGGSGTFHVVQTAPAPCGQRDDGTTETAVGLQDGGEIGWLTAWKTGPESCLETWDFIETAYGTALFPGSVTNGAASKVVVYEDADSDDDPTTGLAVQVKVTTVVLNGDTDILNKVPLGVTMNAATTSDAWTLVSADHVAGQFPGPLDSTLPTHAAVTWGVGSSLGPGTLDTTDLNANDIPPLNMAANGLPGNWLLRVGYDPICVGTQLCFGDGSGSVACPCGNEGEIHTGGGCANGAPMPAGQGAVLVSSGTNGVLNDDLILTAYFTTNQPGLFFQGNNAINGGNGVAFGDGIRCCGAGVIRLEIVDPPGPSGSHTASTTAPVLGTSPPGTTIPGNTRCYQWWYRNPGTSLCGTNFNLSNAVLVTWTPGNAPSESGIPPRPGPHEGTRYRVALAPIPGWTTVPHAMPRAIRIPRGAELEMELSASLAGDLDGDGRVSMHDVELWRRCFAQQDHALRGAADLDESGFVDNEDYLRLVDAFGSSGGAVLDSVRWVGATETRRSRRASSAVVSCRAPGVYVVACHVGRSGASTEVFRAQIEVVDVDPESIAVQVDSLDAYHPYRTGMLAMLGGSVASVETLSERVYLTSNATNVLARGRTDPPGFESLLEWSKDGVPIEQTGPQVLLSVDEAGVHDVAAGHLARQDYVELVTYQTVLKAPIEPGEDWPIGESMTFSAETIPTGYSDRIQWFAYAHGRAVDPPRAVGPYFTVAISRAEPGSGDLWANVRANESAADGAALLVTRCAKLCFTRGCLLSVSSQCCVTDEAGGDKLVGAACEELTGKACGLTLTCNAARPCNTVGFASCKCFLPESY